MDKLVFSTILYVDHDDRLPQALEELNQCDLFPEQGQLIVVDPHSSDTVKAACEALHNCAYFPLPGAELPAAYNLGLEQAGGQYINFTLASARYSPDFYAKAQKALKDKSVPMVSANPTYEAVDGSRNPYTASFKQDESKRIIELAYEPRQFQLMLQAYLFRAKMLQGRRFDETLHDDALRKFLLELQMEHPSYCALASSVQYLYTVPLEDEVSPNLLQLCPWWYTDSVTRFILPLLRQAKQTYRKIPTFVQKALYYEIYCKFNCNLNARTKGTLHTKEDVEAFYHAVDQALALLDNRVIMGLGLTPYTPIGRRLRFLMLRRKAAYLGKKIYVIDNGNQFIALLNKPGEPLEDVADCIAPIGSTRQESIRVRAMNYQDGNLVIDADVPLSDYLDPEEFQIYAVSTVGRTSTVHPAEHVNDYPLIKYFNYTQARKYTVQFTIPVSDKEQHIQVFFQYQNSRHQMQVNFIGSNSRLDQIPGYSYWMFRKGWAVSCTKKGEFILRKVSPLFHLKRELLHDRSILRNEENRSLARKAILLRWLYWLVLPFFRKRNFWVSFDKLYKAGDNGEYMFQYLRREQKQVQAYYIVEKTAPDYQRLKRQHGRHILTYGTLRCTLHALTAQVILATHSDIPLRFDPEKKYLTYYKDLMRGKVVCIQHGLTIQKIAQYQNRLVDNTQLYCLASPYELENVSRPIYGYKPEALKMTGLARYDGLTNRDQKIILITPSWRRNVILSSVGSVRRPHNDNFRQTDYFKIYNRLINDQTLIDCAKRSGYRVIYLLHPVMSEQINDFDRNDYVELIPATGDMSYEKILCESSLMVTDYSGVQFDFAYMRKPILYYHPDDLPPHYDEGGMSYATQGFGPICTTHEQIVSALCDAMERGCTTQEEYIRRADDFFAYDDHNNCQRIYDAVHSWLEETK